MAERAPTIWRVSNDGRMRCPVEGRAAAEAGAVCEGLQEQGVDCRDLAEVVEHVVGAFVDKGDGADLNTDHRRLGELRRQRESAGGQQRALEKRASVHGSASFPSA